MDRALAPFLLASLAGILIARDTCAQRAPAGSQTRKIEAARVLAIAEDRSRLVLAGPPPIALAVEEGLRERLGEFTRGDLVTVELSGEGDARALRSIRAATILQPSRSTRFKVLGCAALFWFLVAFVFTKRRPLRLVIGEDGRFSNSKVQTSLWFGAVVVAYTATLYLRWREGDWSYVGGVNLPENLIVLSGISALTLAGAKGITENKLASVRAQARAKNLDETAAVLDAKPLADKARLVTDLACDDAGNPDLADFQMLVITLLAVAVFSVQVFVFLGSMELRHFVTIPDVDSTVLATFGLGQGAYLAKKLVSAKP